MPSGPRVSVIMAVYNGERHLAAAVDSVLAQSFTDFELVVVDDTSSDGTAAMLADYAARDDRVIVLRNAANLGPYPSANRALEIARAPLIARTDADDICMPDRLERQVGFMEANLDHMICGGGYRSIDGAGRHRFERGGAMDHRIAGWVARLRMPMVHPGFCFRATFPDGTPVRYGEDFPIAQDFALASRLARAGRIAVLGGVLVEYRMHEGNISTRRNQDQNAFARKVSGGAVAAHYPAELQAGLAAFLDCYFQQSMPDAGRLALAARALRAAIAFDAGADKALAGALKPLAAGMLAEAFLRGGGLGKRAGLGLAFAIKAPDFLLPLLARYTALARG